MAMKRAISSHKETKLSKPVPDLEPWLKGHPQIAEAIGWVNAAHERRSYLEWTAEARGQLAEAFRIRWIQKPSMLEDPPPNVLKPRKCASPETAFCGGHAWPLYLAHVANSLVVEIKKEVAWSLDGYSKPDLESLLHGEQMFRHKADGLYHLDWKRTGRAVPAPPELACRFMRPMLSGTPLETICRLIDWCANLQHYATREYYDEGFVTGNMELTWDYNGLPPVSRIIGRTFVKRSNEMIEELKGLRSWTAGCWGTTGFLRAVLRTVNIPVRQIVIKTADGTHALPYFPSEKLYLSHGDDPYDSRWKGLGLPGRDLLIDKNIFRQWFGKRASALAKKLNIARQPAELEIRMLPEYLVRLYIDDIEQNRSNKDSKVAEYFKENINYLALERKELWKNLKERRELWGM